jgi:hypothetical protein
LLLYLALLALVLGDEVFLPLVHLVEIITAPELTRHEEEVEHCRGDLECHGTAIPKAAKKVQGEDRLDCRLHYGCNHGHLEELLEEVVGGRVDAVENDRDVGEELRDDVKCA